MQTDNTLASCTEQTSHIRYMLQVVDKCLERTDPAHHAEVLGVVARFIAAPTDEHKEELRAALFCYAVDAPAGGAA